MHCWRHKTPSSTAPPRSGSPAWTSARSEAQPAETLRDDRAARHREHAVLSRWGKARLHGMIANRPDWTLSRQRQWGVPMAFFMHQETGELHPRTPELLEAVAKRVEAARHRGLAGARRRGAARRRRGAVREEQRHAGRVVRLGLHAPHRAARLATRIADRASPADLYLEGSDQHRGWFHSSLLISCMLDGVPPYKALLTHGFVVDGEGRKMSQVARAT